MILIKGPPFLLFQIRRDMQTKEKRVVRTSSIICCQPLNWESRRKWFIWKCGPGYPKDAEAKGIVSPSVLSRGCSETAAIILLTFSSCRKKIEFVFDEALIKKNHCCSTDNPLAGNMGLRLGTARNCIFHNHKLRYPNTNRQRVCVCAHASVCGCVCDC